jgi:hypothetical protein
MKKRICIILVALTLLLSSCATILGGQITECQRTKPAPGKPSREVRVGYLIVDIILLAVPFTLVDFITCAIYKPCK